MPDTIAGPDPAAITAEQREDIATLFAEHMTVGTIESLAEAVLGRPAVAALRDNEQSDRDFSRAVIELMHETNRVGEALAVVCEFCRDVRLIRALNHVTGRRRIADFDALQKIVKSPDDPFLDDRFVEEVYPGLRRKMCAIGLGDAENVNEVIGSGFLVGPDEVMTNFHVVEDYLEEAGEVDGQMTYRERVKGDNIFCFFDYTAAPKPEVPPPPGFAGVVVNAATEGWLVCASGSLAGDGKPPHPTKEQVGRKFDYAIIRLAQRMGERLSRRSGGALRGWVELRGDVEEPGKKPLIIVMQHPDGMPLLFDVGEFDRLDVSGTRVWYAVNTAHGSSGGAAINKKGHLYALHNAQVWEDKTTPRRVRTNQEVNQGVRIATILNDLARPPKRWVPTPPPQSTDMGYWSLTDSLEQALPIIGRQAFRETVLKMMKPDSPTRLLSVVGHPGSGRNFSVPLLRRIVGGNVPIIEFSPSDLERLSPDKFLLAIKRQLGLPDSPAMPLLSESSNTPQRWRNLALPEWLNKALNEGQQKHPAHYPCWIVLNAVGKKEKFEDPDPPLDWAEGLYELVAALTGGHDPGQPVPEIPHLRWLMLGEKASLFPPTAWPREIDDLDRTSNDEHRKDFGNCVVLAYAALSRVDAPPELLARVAKQIVARVSKSTVRSILAEMVRDALRDE